ncbi:hypothetical protein GCM10009678_16600 [Actinomadura kijaniata]|uniref:Uncharacterized protein n=1 Tax=Actinomadura namibiensis TaxID=182080 RepID=A0A7W3LIS0_ACTNM|nr:DUF6247 family protein [Actinomadura namibiensis]MBA8948860.1 hypothetical protein [Actinomadura namibiensis]
MTAEAIDQYTDDPNDPERILARLPERERARFLEEYRATAEAAANEVWRYRQLRRFLHEWSLRAVAYSAPDFYDRREAARRGEGDYITLDELVARREP